MGETFVVVVWETDGTIEPEVFLNVTDARIVEGFLRILQADDTTTSINTKYVRRTKSMPNPEEEPF